ncbi:MAG: hypothetical protein DRJ34_04955, partial [Thermoprotei archaeon]
IFLTFKRKSWGRQDFRWKGGEAPLGEEGVIWLGVWKGGFAPSFGEEGVIGAGAAPLFRTGEGTKPLGPKPSAFDLARPPLHFY